MDEDTRPIALDDLNEWYGGMSRALQVMTPPSRERSLAQTKLDECFMWASVAVKRYGLTEAGK